MSNEDINGDALRRILTSGSAFEVKDYLSIAEAATLPDLGSPAYRRMLRTAATIAASAGNMDVVKYFCEERRVPVNFVPPDELLLIGHVKDVWTNTPLLAALSHEHEDVALY